MRRSGIYKAEVQRARQNLLAQGRYPSIDAVRAELGDTGSKTTIHRYLKEIEEAEGGSQTPQVAVSDAIMRLSAQLAGQLREDAEAQVQRISQELEAARAQWNDERSNLHDELSAVRGELERAQLALGEAETARLAMQQHLASKETALVQLSEQLNALKEQLDQARQHARSQEERSRHAQQALEHFRGAAKDQREQLQRQHDEQLQYLQAEIRQLRDANASTQNALAEQRQVANERQCEVVRLEQMVASQRHDQLVQERELKRLKDIEQQHANAATQLAASQSRVLALEAMTTDAVAARDELTAVIKRLELQLDVAQATAASQDQVLRSLSAFIAGLDKPNTEQLITPNS